MHQVECVIKSDLLSMFGRLQISDRLLLEELSGPEGHIVYVYIGVEDDGNFFREAISIIELFLLTCALSSDISATYHNVIGTDISRLKDLGKRRIAYNTGYETIEVSHPPPEFLKPILSAKERFLKLDEDREKILGSYLGLALRYYYFAIQSYFRKPQRIDEMIIDLSISAEALFSTGAKFKRNLQYRLSNFIASNESDKNEISRKIGDFYDYRGAIVHGGTKKKRITINEVILAKNYVQKAIDKALSLKLYQKKELIEYIEKQTLSQ